MNEFAKLLNKNVWVVTNVNSIHNKYHVFPARITKVSIDQCSFPLLDGKPKVAYVTCSLKAFTIGCFQNRNGDILRTKQKKAAATGTRSTAIQRCKNDTLIKQHRFYR